MVSCEVLGRCSHVSDRDCGRTRLVMLLRIQIKDEQSNVKRCYARLNGTEKVPVVQATELEDDEDGGNEYDNGSDCDADAVGCDGPLCSPSDMPSLPMHSLPLPHALTPRHRWPIRRMRWRNIPMRRGTRTMPPKQPSPTRSTRRSPSIHPRRLLAQGAVQKTPPPPKQSPGTGGRGRAKRERPKNLQPQR